MKSRKNAVTIIKLIVIIVVIGAIVLLTRKAINSYTAEYFNAGYNFALKEIMIEKAYDDNKLEKEYYNTYRQEITMYNEKEQTKDRIKYIVGLQKRILDKIE